MASDDPHNERVRTLSTWLTASSDYVPPYDRDGFLRKNLLSLASMLVALRADSLSQDPVSSVDKFLRRVRPSLRLVGVLAFAVCVALARNMAFVWTVLVGWLLLLALQPAGRIRTCLMPALGVAAAAALVNVPALLLGQTAAPLRMASKALVSAGLVASLASSLGAQGMLGALRALRFPARACMVLDLAIRDVVLLGESARSLSEALALRSVGKDRAKTASAAGVMGAVFVRAHTMAAARAEAMELRGYDGSFFGASVPRRGWDMADVAYCVVLVGAIGLFVYWELAL